MIPTEYSDFFAGRGWGWNKRNPAAAGTFFITICGVECVEVAAYSYAAPGGHYVTVPRSIYLPNKLRVTADGVGIADGPILVMVGIALDSITDTALGSAILAARPKNDGEPRDEYEQHLASMLSPLITDDLSQMSVVIDGEIHTIIAASGNRYVSTREVVGSKSVTLGNGATYPIVESSGCNFLISSMPVM